jgi:hypothetical protein
MGHPVGGTSAVLAASWRAASSGPRLACRPPMSGAHPSGVDGHNDHSVRREQPGGADGDGVESGLGCVVADVPADLRADGHRSQPGGEIDHLAGGAIDELGKQRPGDQHRPGSVDPDLAKEVLGADLEGAALAGCRAEGPASVPAALISRSTFPVAATCEANWMTSSSSPTSRQHTCAPRAARSAARPGTRHPAHTSSPCSRQRNASARPRPRAAPVMTTRLITAPATGQDVPGTYGVLRGHRYR